MKIKVFKIRINKRYLESDQNKVNEFLESVEFKKSTNHLVEGKIDYWTTIIHYKPIEIGVDEIT